MAEGSEPPEVTGAGGDGRCDAMGVEEGDGCDVTGAGVAEDCGRDVTGALLVLCVTCFGLGQGFGADAAGRVSWRLNSGVGVLVGSG